MLRKIIFFLFFLPPLYVVYLIVVYLRTHVPYVVTPKKRLPCILKEMRINSETTIYDLGCGIGTVLFAAEKYHPKKLVGFELSPVHAWYAKIKAWILHSDVQVYCRDFFTADIRDADIIYLFLVQSAVEKIWPKIQKEAKPGTRVVILSNHVPGVEGTYTTMSENGASLPGGVYVYTL